MPAGAIFTATRHRRTSSAAPSSSRQERRRRPTLPAQGEQPERAATGRMRRRRAPQRRGFAFDLAAAGACPLTISGAAARETCAGPLSLSLARSGPCHRRRRACAAARRALGAKKFGSTVQDSGAAPRAHRKTANRDFERQPSAWSGPRT